jgi:hypothetical protein
LSFYVHSLRTLEINVNHLKYRFILENLKRKSEYNLKDEVCKKVRAPVAEKDLGGELVLPF